MNKHLSKSTYSTPITQQQSIYSKSKHQLHSQKNSQKSYEQAKSIISQTPVQQQLTQLRKIQAGDTFPCYACFDQQKQRINCEVCNKLGYLQGDHPMVMFVDDFLNKNLLQYAKMSKGVDQTKTLSKLQQTQQQTKIYPITRNLTATRKQCRSALQSYTSKQQIQSSSNTNPTYPNYTNNTNSNSQQIPIKLIKSLNPISTTMPIQQQIHHAYCCNICQCSPIIGKRYHCQQCQDYDMCQKCYEIGAQSDDHKRYHRIDVIAGCRKVYDIVNMLIKSNVNNNDNNGGSGLTGSFSGSMVGSIGNRGSIGKK